LIAILAGTGVLLMFALHPSPDQAYSDMLMLQSAVWFGPVDSQPASLERQPAVDCHFFCTCCASSSLAAFAPPREFNWVLGWRCCCSSWRRTSRLSAAVDQLAYWAVTVGSSLLSYVPLVGEPLRNFLLGGPWK
jgi:quinol-cytochrome oxidoreductase complex cytochrome b subunit